MRRRIPPTPWPAGLDEFRLDEWASKPHPYAAWARARFDHWVAHPEMHVGVDPIDLLKAARDARRMALYESDR